MQNAVGLQLTIATPDPDFGGYLIDTSYLTPIDEDGEITIPDETIGTIVGSIGSKNHVVLVDGNHGVVYATPGYFTATE